MRLLAALALPALMVLGLAYVGVRVAGDFPPPARPHASAIVWGDRVFVNRSQLAHWLHSRGMSYRVWARRHPVRAGLEPPAAARPPAESPLPAGETRHGSGWALRLEGGALGLAAVGLLLAFRRRHSGGGPMLRRATEAVRVSGSRAGSAALVAWHGRRELGWYVAGALLVAGSALVVTAVR